MVTIAEELPGWRVRKSFGVVQSLVVNKYEIGTSLNPTTVEKTIFRNDNEKECI
jgi:hypothetical protein